MLFLASCSITEAPDGRAGRAFSNPCQNSTSFTSLSEQAIDLACPEIYFTVKEAGNEPSSDTAGAMVPIQGCSILILGLTPVRILYRFVNRELWGGEA